MKRILLVEPAYKIKYPPLGLMKISQYHKAKGDHVEFIKGLSPEIRDKFEWDKIYVASLFTYDWKETIKALKYYRYSVKEPTSENLIVGGVLATLMGDDIKREVECKVVRGLLDKKGKLGYDDDNKIDNMVPDYSILDDIDFKYPMSNAYIVYATRGCIRRCEFCAVHRIEPKYKEYISLKKQVEQITKLYGPKKDLLLLDNNILASSKFEKIIKEIKEVGFERGAQFTYKGKLGQPVKANRYVDFNQGVDGRLLTEEKMALLSEIAIRPLRIAFDDISYKDLYIEKIKLAAKYKIKHLSNYILFNYKDKPDDFYHRLKINVDLNEELGLHIYSFPMRYIDLTSKDRSVNTVGNVGQYWNKKYLRAIQCVLNVTKGVVGPNKQFFKRAFGKNVEEFNKIMLMPEEYIFNRDKYRDNGLADIWWCQYLGLNNNEKEQLLWIILTNNFKDFGYKNLSKNVLKVLEHYIRDDTQISFDFTDSELLKLNTL